MDIIYNTMDLLDEKLMASIEETISYSLESEGVHAEEIEISISLVTNDEIRELNSKYRGRDAVTDVLSFPQYTSLDEIKNERSFLCLGDIVISLDKVREQSGEYGHSFERELLYLTIHSILHLMGYDHIDEEEKMLMRSKEENILRHLSIER
ncbi:MAG: rRNA maturation RNase YbeY [Peptostreptococcales bacterium]|jgi:probable rRNA maturation factor